MSHLVDCREVKLGGLDPGGSGSPCHLQHPGGWVVPPLDGGHPPILLQILDQVAAFMPQHAKVCQLHAVITSLAQGVAL